MSFLEIALGYIVGRFVYKRGLRILIWLTWRLPIAFRFNGVGSFCLFKTNRNTCKPMENLITIIPAAFIERQYR